MAFDQATGSIVWGPLSLGTGYQMASAAYENGKLFVMEPQQSEGGKLQGLEAATGTLLWSVTPMSGDAFGSPPRWASWYTPLGAIALAPSIPSQTGLPTPTHLSAKLTGIQPGMARPLADISVWEIRRVRLVPSTAISCGKVNPQLCAV
jgi:PQQ-like domain